MNLPRTRNWLLAAWGIFLLGCYIPNHNPGTSVLNIFLLCKEFAAHFTISSYLPKALGASLSIGLFCLALMILGRLVIRRFCRHFPEELLLGLGLGLGLGTLSSVMSILNFLQLSHPFTAWTLYGLAVIGLAFCLLKKPLRPDISAFFSSWSTLEKTILAAIFLFLWAGSLIPEITYDPLVYHLAYPSLYEMHGGFVATPHSIYAAFPQNTEMLYLFGMLIGDEIQAKAFQMAAVAALILTFIGASKLTHGEKRPGYLAVLAFFCVPMAAYNVWTCFIDTHTTFFFWSALILAADAIHRGRLPPLILGGLFCGWSMGTKYTAYPLILIFPIAMWICRRSAVNRSAQCPPFHRMLLCFALPAAIISSPWIIRNMIVHHNPIYPFLGVHWGIPPIVPENWARLMIDANAHHPLEWISHPLLFFRTILDPMNWILHQITTGEHIGVVFLFCLGWVIINVLYKCADPMRHPIGTCSRICLVCGAVLWMICGGVPRFMMMYLPPLFYLWSLDVHKDLTAAAHFQKLSPTRLTVLLVLIVSCINTVATFVYMDGRRVLWGIDSKESFLASHLGLYPAPPFSAYEFLNEHAPQGSKVLLIGEARSYYLKRPFISASVYDVQPIASFARNSADGEDLYQTLSKRKIDFIVVNVMEAERLQSHESYDMFRWDEAGLKVFREFWGSHVELVHHRVSLSDGVVLFVYKIVEGTDHPADIPAAITGERIAIEGSGENPENPGETPPRSGGEALPLSDIKDPR